MLNQGTIKNLALVVKRAARNRDHFIIALTGFGGAGKSTAADKLAAALGDAAVIPLDHFITHRSAERSPDWDGFDWARLIEQVLKPIQEGEKTITYGVYDWPQNKVIEHKTIQLHKYIIIEGCGLIRDQLEEYFDFSIWIDLPLDIASERGSTRDKKEYNVDHDKLWKERWVPNDKDYFDRHQPATNADFLLRV